VDVFAYISRRHGSTFLRNKAQLSRDDGEMRVSGNIRLVTLKSVDSRLDAAQPNLTEKLSQHSSEELWVNDLMQ